MLLHFRDALCSPRLLPCPLRCGILLLCTSADPGLRSEISVLPPHAVLGSDWCCLQNPHHRLLSCAWCRSSELIHNHKVQRGFKIFFWSWALRTACNNFLKTSDVFSSKASRVELLTPQDFRNHKRAIQLKITSSSFKIHNGGLEVLSTHQLCILCMQNLEPLSSQARLLHPVHLFLTGLFVWKWTAVRAIRSIKINVFMGNTYLAFGKK